MKSIFKDFKAFAMRGNLLDLVIGFTVGATFATVAKSLVNDIVMPPIGLLLGKTDFSNDFIVLKAGEALAPPYLTLEAAKAAGATTLNYGSFLTNVVALLVIAVAMFAIVRSVTKVSEAIEDEFGDSEADSPDLPTTKKCAYCREVVAAKASRCPKCTSFLGTEGGPGAPDARITPGT